VPFPATVLELVRFAVPPHRINPLLYQGRTFAPHDALAHGLVDEVVPADALAARAHEVAAQLAAISPAAFRLTKRMLRAPVLERIDASSAHDEEALAVWLAPDTHARIREYLAKTVRK
jgi:enoyl-CoA hydratase